jgi:hypothetical protein
VKKIKTLGGRFLPLVPCPSLTPAPKAPIAITPDCLKNSLLVTIPHRLTKLVFASAEEFSRKIGVRIGKSLSVQPRDDGQKETLTSFASWFGIDVAHAASKIVNPNDIALRSSPVRVLSRVAFLWVTPLESSTVDVH